MNIIEELRRTGRTTRMVEDALKHAKNGKDVVILCPRIECIEHVLRMFRDRKDCDIENYKQGSGIYAVEHVSGKKIYVTIDSDFDYRKMMFEKPTFIGRNDFVILLDHYALEERYRPILMELHQYDRHETIDDRYLSLRRTSPMSDFNSISQRVLNIEIDKKSSIFKDCNLGLGRTRRMLKRALVETLENNHVDVAFHCSQSGYFYSMLELWYSYGFGKITVKGADNFEFRSATGEGVMIVFDGNKPAEFLSFFNGIKRSRDDHPRFLHIDHRVIGEQFSDVLEMWHRYIDKPKPREEKTEKSRVLSLEF